MGGVTGTPWTWPLTTLICEKFMTSNDPEPARVIVACPGVPVGAMTTVDPPAS